MTLQYDTLNTVSAQGASVLWLLKGMLVTTCGWTVPRSGNGTTGGDGDNISGEGDLDNTNSWIVFRRPDDGAEWCFARGADNYRWNILYSKGALFTGGSSSARATATDEKYVVTTAEYTFYGEVTNIVADDAAPYGFVAYCWATSDGTAFGGVIYDPMEKGLTGDPDPYICGAWSGYDRYRNIESGDTDAVPRAKGWASTTWGAIPGHIYDEAGGLIAVPGKTGTNPYSGSTEVPVVRIHHARSSDAGTRGIWKGVSTFTRWYGTATTIRNTITVGSNVWIVMGRNAELLLPWEPGVTPVSGYTNFAGEEVESYDGSALLYTKRARDDGYDPSVVFVYWQTLNVNGAYPGTPSGTLQDTVIVGVEVKT
jgi:hypothetical protein